ncbi:MAG: sterol desaturase family protein [Fibrobacterota bacterium]|nr:sterol desaturase family protein [Fibrobacterota bacterium]
MKAKLGYFELVIVVLTALSLGILTLAGRRRPLRISRSSQGVRIPRNLLIAGLGAWVVNRIENPLARWACARAQSKGIGLLQWRPLRGWPAFLMAVLLLDYTLYLWHILTHRVPWLWRFHRVHHLDADLDTSTALRFHAGEMLLSVPWRLLQILLLGVSLPAFRAWKLLLTLSVLFHHSNLKLSDKTERVLRRWIMTPALHGIHHSRNLGEMDSNWSSGFTLWDRIHGTLKTGIRQDTIEIGSPDYSGSQSLWAALTLPFRKPARWSHGDRLFPNRGEEIVGPDAVRVGGGQF